MVLMLLFIYVVIAFQGINLDYISSESTLLEKCQHLFLIIIIGCCAFSAKYFEHWREVFIAMMAIALMMLIREHNNYFKDEWFDGAWQLGVMAVILPTAIFLKKRFSGFKDQVKSLLAMQPAGTLMTGLFILLVFSRLVGQKEIWQSVMKDHYLYSVKMIIEESAELLGYGVILVSVVNLMLFIHLKLYKLKANIPASNQH